MAKRVSYIITDSNVTVNYDGQTHIVDRGSELSSRLIQALRDGKMDEIPNLVSTAKRVENFSEGNFVVRNGEILVNGVPAPKVLGDKIVKFANEGLPYRPLVKFAANLQANPSFRAVNELFTFLEKNDHPLTEEGNFIAYKRVRGDFKDIHSGTFDNSPGTEPSMPRNQVNEDAVQTCSYGLHVANWNYAHTQFASSDPLTDVMLEVEVNPADVVAIPIDYNNAKMRVCKYKVLGVVDKEHSSEVALRVVSPTPTNVASDDQENLEDTNYCEECWLKLQDDESYICRDCEYGEDHRCEYCDQFDCYGDCEEEEESEEEDEEDPYPFEDELEK